MKVKEIDNTVFKYIAIIITFAFCWSNQQEFAQIKEFEEKMIQNYDDLVIADSDLRYEFTAPKFKEELRAVLLKPKTFKYPFDSLGKYINIISSQDKRLRLYSWDEMTGGTWHQMAALAQYTNEAGNIYCENLDSDFYGDETDISDIIFYKINDVVIQNIPNYIVFGWGTFGGGSHFKIVKVFTIIGNKITDNNKIFKLNDKLISELYLSTSRSNKINLDYNSKNQVIEFDEFRRPSENEEEMGYMHPIPTGNTIKLKFNGKVFENE